MIRELLEQRAGEEYELYARAINPQFVRVLKTIGFDRMWARTEGQYLYDSDGNRYLDMLGGFGMFNVGRNNPRVRAALIETLELQSPGSVQLGVSLLPGLLAEALLTGKLVALPRFDSVKKSYRACQIRNLTEDLLSGQFGIREPNNSCPVVPLNRLDLILVPGVAFDLHGRRLGRGKGHYDATLAAFPGRTIALAFDARLVPEVPVGEHDRPVDAVCTESRLIVVNA